MGAAGLHGGGEEGRTGAGDDGFGGEGSADLFEEVHFDFDAFGAAFLNEVCAFDGLQGIWVEGEAGGVGAGGQAEGLEGGPGGFDEAMEEGFGSGGGVAGADNEALGQEVCGPAGTDGAAAQDGDGCYGVGH